MNYKKMWNTLKAESGYRATIGWARGVDINIKTLMENLETRAAIKIYKQEKTNKIKTTLLIILWTICFILFLANFVFAGTCNIKQTVYNVSSGQIEIQNINIQFKKFTTKKEATIFARKYNVENNIIYDQNGFYRVFNYLPKKTFTCNFISKKER